MRLTDKVAVITGSSRGIGRAVALGYAREGARVALAYYAGSEGAGDAERVAHNRAQADAALAAVQTTGADAILVEGDISDPEQVDALFSRVRAEFGPVDILVNNAGTYPRTSWAEMDLAVWQRVLDVNLTGAFLCSKAATPDMVQSGCGKIINVSSVTYLLGTHSDLAHYISSKGGIIGLTRALARDLGRHNIQVNAITPGAIQNEMELEMFPNQEELTIYLNERQCLQRRGTPEDLVGAFIFLASHESDFITGQTLNVDGGWAMH